MMKLIKATGGLGLLLALISFTPRSNIYAESVKVVVTIDRLKAISKDACNGQMDFKGKITILSKSKNFDVMEGNDIRPGWKHEHLFKKFSDDFVIKIEIWDDDDAMCGGGDDVVIVDPGGAQRITITQSTAASASKTTAFVGKKISGKEQAEIKFTITVTIN
jgi:hypothetical protein